MRRPDIGDDADIRGGDFRQPGDFAAGAHAHLQNRPAVPGLQTEESMRQPDQVVEVPLGLQPRSGQRQNAGQHLLGGRFAGRPGNRRQRSGEFAPDCRRQIAQGAQGVGHPDDRYRQTGHHLLAETGGSATAHRQHQEIVPVEALAA